MRSARLSPPARPAVVLVAHGSRDPRAAASTEALARAVGRARPAWAVRAAYLDHAGPRPLDVLAGLPGPRAVLVPLLLTAAYHGRVDLPAVIREAAQLLPVAVTATDVLGPTAPLRPGSALPLPSGSVSPLLLAALTRRLPVDDLDAVVLAAAGTRNDEARQTVADAAAAFGRHLGLPSAVSYASGPGQRADAAVDGLRAAGARRVGMAAYFLAPGVLYDASADAARAAGAVAIAEPLGAAPELVRLVCARAESVLRVPLPVAA